MRLVCVWVHNLRSEFSAADWPSAVSVLLGDRCRDCGLCDPRVRICRRLVPDDHDDHDGRFPRGSPAVHGGPVLHDRADPHGCGNRAVHVRDPPRSAHRGAPTPAAGEAADGAANRPDDWSFHHLRMGPRWSGQRAVSQRARQTGRRRRHLSQAVPGYPPHPEMLRLLGEAAASPKTTGYGPIEGEDVLREAYAEHMSAV